MPFVKPSNKILVGGAPIVEELVTEGTSCKPGLFVKKGTADHQVALAGDGEQKPLGVLEADPRYPITQAFPDKHPVRVLKAPAVVVAVLASGNSVVKGAPLVCAANGELKTFASYPPSSPIVAYAEETVDASSEDKTIMVRLAI